MSSPLVVSANAMAGIPGPVAGGLTGGRTELGPAPEGLEGFLDCDLSHLPCA